MKGFIKLSLLSVVLFSSILVRATTIDPSNKNKKSTTNIFFENVKNGSVILIKDVNNLVLYRELIKKDGNYSKGFDLKKLPNGIYFFELQKTMEITVIPFSVYGKEVMFSKNKEEKILAPVAFVKANRVYISIPKKSKSESISVSFYFEGSELAYTDKIDRGINLKGKIYDFSTSIKGKYTVVMNVNGRSFKQQIKI